ncbi:NAD-dependent protein lipoamidase sirtuin-4, mitochondrial [Trichoplax sp. H2]|nr:NAD-dependent protein lipoamidase sirtuin-4, mitochondrial [Trichoplax sp. H2]|eukprot:RDD40986.1 NAD-dependent protein lipoamidase sirtuin-4, mitochondrial [Trichoplax sp. H2]
MISNSRNLTSFIPHARQITQEDVQLVSDFMLKSKKLLILTGAGVSTASGIPDYRSKGVGLYARSNQRPMQYSDFLENDENRKRYWSRNFTGWSRFSSVKPNLTHNFIAKLEQLKLLHWVVTQNVDGLHQRAGSSRLTELHGTMHEVICLQCQKIILRREFQDILSKLNPNWTVKSIQTAPDADVFIAENEVMKFNLAKCECGGVLKPNVVFFGGSISKDINEEVKQHVDEADSILVVGSSLQTYSAYRIISRASDMRKPIGIVSIGETRADHLASFKISINCNQLFENLQLSAYS